MRISSYINKGNSFPVILEDKGNKYFVKLRAGMSGKYALISEWFGNKLGSQLNIKTQVPIWIDLESDLNMEGIHIEVKELIEKSMGLNIGFEYQEAAIEITADDIKLFDRKITNEIFLFDLVMINIDRTVSNTNLMQVKNELISVDYESSLLFQEIIGNKNFLDDNRILHCFRTNPLYEKTTESAVDEFIKKLKQVSIKEIIDEIPFDLLTETERDLFIKGIEEKIKNGWFLKETMNKLENLKAETREERKIRVNKNQANFKRKFKENIDQSKT